MAFTEEDNCKEILLKVMIAEAWRGGGPTAEDRMVIADWIAALGMEGPERMRVEELLTRSVDEFQADLYDSQLKAVLASGSGCSRMDQARARILSGRRNRYALEERLCARIETSMNDSSGIDRLFAQARRAV